MTQQYTSAQRAAAADTLIRECAKLIMLLTDAGNLEGQLAHRNTIHRQMDNVSNMMSDMDSMLRTAYYDKEQQ